MQLSPSLTYPQALWISLGVKYLCYIECYAVDNRWQLLELVGEFEVVGV